jgi:imidazolonepropionase-like amidohydrolase
MEWVRRFALKGGTVVAGTDIPFGGIMFHAELASLVDLGLSPLQAIAAGTGTAARVAGCGDWLGTIRPGQRADLLLMAARPDQDITTTREIDMVLVDGSAVTPGSLRSPGETRQRATGNG